MKPHFYNLRSRLGMIHAPYRQDALNIGVENGGDAILTENFLSHFSDSTVDAFEFSKPEDIDKSAYFTILAKELDEAQKFILSSLKSKELLVAVGGDNSISFPTLTATLEKANPAKVGYIRIDSHPDMNSIESSPTGNFHGMWMRPFVNGFEDMKIAGLVKKRVGAEQLFFLGNLDIDPGEQEYFDSGAIAFFPESIAENKQEMLAKLDQFLTDYPSVYLGIDIDGFDGSIAPATGIPASKGLFLEDVEEVFEKVKSHLISVDMVEVNPQKDGAEQTIALAQKILLSLLQ